MNILENFITISNDILWSYVLIILLIGLGVYFSIRTNFIQIRLLGEMLRLLGQGVGENKGKNSVSSFQAFCISTASRVGTGNIAGVAIAVASGGPGAVFWMWLIALLGSATGFVESTLAQIYKVPDEKGGFRGGPAYYMDKALGQKWMGVFFAILISITFGLVFNSVQTNTITVALNNAYGIDRFSMGLLLSVLTAIIIFGGVKRIAQVTEWMVPIMAGIYILMAVYIMIVNVSLLPGVFHDIFVSAFNLNAAAGGGFGAAVMMGIKRGLFSNEAGMGSVPNAAATADVSHPVKQGLIQALGVFVDTFMVCSSSAFIVLLAGSYTTPGLTGIELAQTSLSHHIGPWATEFLAVIIFLFAYSSVIGNYYYGETNIGFLNANSLWLNIYRIAVVGMVLFGSVAKVALVWDMADLFMALMALTNMAAIFFLGKYAFAAANDYIQQLKAGKEPTFHVSNIPGLKNADCWKD